MGVWILLAIVVLFAVLDRKGILQYNNILMFLIYIYIAPFTMALSLAMSLLGIIGLISHADHALSTFLKNSLFSTVAFVVMIYIIVRICRHPLNKKYYKKSEPFEAACLKRLTLYRRIVFIPAVVMWGFSFIEIVKILFASGKQFIEMMLSPGTLLLAIITFGVAYFAFAVAILVHTAALSLPFLIIMCFSSTLCLFAFAFSISQLVRLNRIRKINKVIMILWALSVLFFPINIITAFLMSRKVKNSLPMITY